MGEGFARKKGRVIFDFRISIYDLERRRYRIRHGRTFGVEQGISNVETQREMWG